MKKIIAFLCASAMAACTLPVTAAENTKPIFETDFSSSDGFELKNGAILAENGKSGKGLYLDGTDDYVLLPNNILSDEMTISAWVKQDKKAVWGRLFDFGTNSNVNFFFAPSSGGASRVEVKNGAAVDTMEAPEFEKVGVWAYYTVTVTPSEICLYRDGLLRKKLAAGNVKLSEMENTANYIGKSHYDADAYFSGMVDDFKIYDRVLTKDEILADMGEHTDFNDSSELLDTYASALKDGQTVFGDTINLPFAQIGDMTVAWTCWDGIIDTKSGRINAPEHTAVSQIDLITEMGENSDFKEFSVTVPGKSESPFTVDINAADRSADVSDEMWGLFFEDINSAADGGIYAELIQNGSFEYPDNLYSWETSDGITVGNDYGIHENNPTYVIMPPKSAISNDGYMGMSVNANEKYNFSLFTSKDASVKISLQDSEAELKASGDEEWQKLSTVLTPSRNSTDAKLVIENTGNESIYLDFVSLMPENTYKNHGLRKDMCEALEAMNPSFLRFPGGCAVEGNTMDVAWNWKDTVGSPETRKQTENIWNSGGEPYIMSYGLGFYEYFQLCEDMNMEPVPILNCGMACQARSGGSTESEYLVPMDKLEPYIQDALDLIEFANGTDMSNEWVQLRCDMGHHEPFGLKYLGIGNEQWGEIYFERYEAFAKAIREKYPEIRLITTSGPASSGDNNDLAWKWIYENDKYADLTDEHYYESADWFRENVHRYDTYKRGTTDVFLGEYASKGNAWYNAISEAAYMTGLERNADVVRMASYAPMFAKYGNTQWTAANMIWFNNDNLVLTPNYHIQSLFMNNTGEYSLDTKTSPNSLNSERHGGIVLGTWLTSADYKDLVITDFDGNVVYTDDFTQWGQGNGEWSVDVSTDILSQTTFDEKCTLFLNDVYADNFTLTVKARKTGGQEGFQVGVLAEDELNYMRVNIGGWANTTAKVQKIVDGTAVNTSNLAEGNYSGSVSVKDNEWQDIKVVVSDDKIEGYLDGELVCLYNFHAEYGPIYTSSTYDSESGETIVKLVNTAETAIDVDINLKNIGYVEPTAKVIKISADSADVNTLENPNKIKPVESTITNAARSFTYSAAAQSVNVIRLKTKGLQILESGALAEYYDNNGNRHEIRMTYENGVLTGVNVD